MTPSSQASILPQGNTKAFSGTEGCKTKCTVPNYQADSLCAIRYWLSTYCVLATVPLRLPQLKQISLLLWNLILVMGGVSVCIQTVSNNYKNKWIIQLEIG